jgi:hypothetical protein
MKILAVSSWVSILRQQQQVMKIYFLLLRRKLSLASADNSRFRSEETKFGISRQQQV